MILQLPLITIPFREPRTFALSLWMVMLLLLRSCAAYLDTLWCGSVGVVQAVS